MSSQPQAVVKALAKGKDRERPKEEVKEEETLGKGERGDVGVPFRGLGLFNPFWI